ncbi:hypothetical protein BDV96DRAFT_565362 [Lophiotrema nucula]|uniref:Uncharacterized protein n=1 Tax=Lophiotrema nucula TaxID=690887 RepID=A0A6A5ZM33_9PLEO|nr:hypothetical protein BDV96DRAFT_565362 [Lophiotrema nucula]
MVRTCQTALLGSLAIPCASIKSRIDSSFRQYRKPALYARLSRAHSHLVNANALQSAYRIRCGREGIPHVSGTNRCSSQQQDTLSYATQPAAS